MECRSLITESERSKGGVYGSDCGGLTREGLFGADIVALSEKSARVLSSYVRVADSSWCCGFLCCTLQG